MFRKTLIVAACAFAGALFMAGPAGATYPPDAPSVGTPASSVGNGASTTVSGSGWQAGSTVALTIASTPQSLGSATVQSDGTFSKDVTLPCVESGTHTITASGTGSDGTSQTATSTISVTGSCSSSGGGTLPHTGSSAAALFTVAAAVGLLGAALVIVTRRRRSAANG
jgi:LPXTG-motif cell wall-anchored protein